MAQSLSGHRPSPSRPPGRTDVSTGSNGGEETPTDLDEDAVFDVLQAERRRVALRTLHEHDGFASIGTLAECVAAVENGVESDALSQSQRKRVYIALYQSHLPKLSEHGVVEFDRDAGLVRLREPARLVLPYLYFDPEEAELPSPGTEGTISSLLRRVRRVMDPGRR